MPKYSLGKQVCKRDIFELVSVAGLALRSRLAGLLW